MFLVYRWLFIGLAVLEWWIWFWVFCFLFDFGMGVSCGIAGLSGLRDVTFTFEIS